MLLLDVNGNVKSRSWSTCSKKLGNIFGRRYSTDSTGLFMIEAREGTDIVCARARNSEEERRLVMRVQRFGKCTHNGLDGSGNQHGWCCPDCGSSERLRIVARIEAVLCSDGTDNLQSDTEYNHKSACRCGCGWSGKASWLLQGRHEDHD